MNKNKLIVKCCPAFRNPITFCEALWIEPVSMLDELKKLKGDDCHYLRCPSLSSRYKNCYLVLCPFDVNINISKTGEISTDMDQNVANLLIQNRHSEISSARLFSFRVQYFFVSNQSLVLQQFHPSTLYSHYPNMGKYSTIEGEFDIGKWVRPIDFAIETPLDKETNISFKRGDPMYAIKFKSDSKVKLEYDHYEDGLIADTHLSQTSIRQVCPISNLSKNYKMVASQMKSLCEKLFTNIKR